MQCSHGPCYHQYSDLTALDHHSHTVTQHALVYHARHKFPALYPQPVQENTQRPTSRGSHLCRTHILSTLNFHHSAPPGADDRRHPHRHHLIAIM